MKPEGTHRRRSIRLPQYDYSQPGAYFVTVVTEGRLHLFGEIVDGEMELNAAGSTMATIWKSLPERYPTFESGSFVVMPNHLHGILVIRDSVGATFMVAPKTGIEERAGMNPAPTTPTDDPTRPVLGDVVGAFKSLTTRAYIDGVRQLSWKRFQRRLWQRNYYEHVIRDESDWKRMHLYVESNPVNWGSDEENSAVDAKEGVGSVRDLISNRTT